MDAEFDSPFANIVGGAGARTFQHLAELTVGVAAIAAWYVTERLTASESAAPDLA